MEEMGEMEMEERDETKMEMENMEEMEEMEEMEIGWGRRSRNFRYRKEGGRRGRRGGGGENSTLHYLLTKLKHSAPNKVIQKNNQNSQEEHSKCGFIYA
jgi:hypothetical protein